MEYKGINYTLVSFTEGKTPQDTDKSAKSFIDYDRAFHQRFREMYGTSCPVQERLDTLVRDYRQNQVTLSIGYGTYAQPWKGGIFIEAETESGEQVLSFLENFLNIEFRNRVFEPINSRKCIQFSAEVDYPGGEWREFYYGFIEEKNTSLLSRVRILIKGIPPTKIR